MTTLIINSGYRATGSWRATNVARGVSDAASSIFNTLRSFQQHVVTSATGQARLAEPDEKLRELFEAIESEVEEDGAKRPSWEAYREAYNVLLNLPVEMPRPTLIPEPHGAIAFEWCKDPQHLFIISVNGTRTMEYAALLGEGDELHGSMSFSEIVPAPIRANLDLFISEL